MEAQEKKPKVSVCVITYNQEKYIRQCLQSIVDQKTEFEFEVIVGDDCSTDGTRVIVQEFVDKFPLTIRTVFQEKRTGGMKNYMDVHAEAKGEFVAHIDGDDLALPNKLQEQARYLDMHPECSVVWHRVCRFTDEDIVGIPNAPDFSLFHEGKVYLSDMLELGNFVFHSSTMYRASCRKTKQTDNDLLDWYFTVELLNSGYGMYLDNILGKYRYNEKTGLSGGARQRITRAHYATLLKRYIETYPEYRKELFKNCIISTLVDAKKMRMTALKFFVLAFKSCCLIKPNKLLLAINRYKLVRRFATTPCPTLY